MKIADMRVKVCSSQTVTFKVCRVKSICSVLEYHFQPRKHMYVNFSEDIPLSHCLTSEVKSPLMIMYFHSSFNMWFGSL